MKTQLCSILISMGCLFFPFNGIADNHSSIYVLKRLEPQPSDEVAYGKAEHETLQVSRRGRRVSVTDPNTRQKADMEFDGNVRLVTASPSKTKLLVSYGEVYEIVDLHSKVRIRLPEKPKVENVLALAGWCWYGENQLIGESGDIKIKDGKPVSGDDDNVKKTRLYLFDIATDELREIALPGGDMNVCSLDFVHGTLIKLIAKSANAAGNGWYVIEKK